MSLTIGKAAKLFGVSPETLRYYEKEGFLSPAKNKENEYREYSFDDLFLLTDLLFYRDIGIPIKDIRQIFSGIGVDEITDLIQVKQQEVEEKIRHLQASLTKLRNWEQLHRESLEYYGRFDIRPMPPALCTESDYEDYHSSLSNLQKSISQKKNLAFFVTLSFYCDFRSSDNPRIQRYVVLDESVSKDLDFDFSPKKGKSKSIIEEKADRCLFTVVKYQNDAKAMMAPLFQHAEETGLRLSGEIYARQSINYYGQEDCVEYYRVYAPIAGDGTPQD